MSHANVNLLREAIARNCAVVLSLPSAGMLRHHKSRFLAEDVSDAGDGFWIESVPAERPLVDSLLASQVPVGLSFKHGIHKVVLATPIRRREPAYRVSASVTVEALVLPFPEHVKALQRRNNYRVRLPADADLSARIWRIGDRAHLNDRPMASQELDIQLRDISSGGVGVAFIGRNNEPPKVTPDDRLRIELTYHDICMLLEGRMRAPTGAGIPGVVRSGVHFKALENDLEGRQKLAQLTRIVGELQRDEVRRTRLGLVKME